jgi:hypothetical protein
MTKSIGSCRWRNNRNVSCGIGENGESAENGWRRKRKWRNNGYNSWQSKMASQLIGWPKRK